MRFYLLGPSGCVQWVANMPNWVPGNTNTIDDVQVISGASLVPTNSRTDDMYPNDLGYHSPKPIYEGQDGRDDCHLLPGGTCYYDGSGLNAGPVLEAFLSYGPGAVWAALARYYQELWGQGGDEITNTDDGSPSEGSA